MKFKSAIIVFVACLSWSSSRAQNTSGESVVTVGVGYSFFFDFVESALNVYDDVKTTSIPAIALTYDHAITDNFSLGLAFGFQTLSADFHDTYTDINNNIVTDEVSASVTRMNIAMRPLLHYGGSENLDLYSGLRIGLNSVTTSYESTQDDFEVPNLGGSRVSVGLVVFGMRYFFSDKVGVNFDLQLGTPYIMSVGVAAKF
jgi:hypothetical protein